MRKNQKPFVLLALFGVFFLVGCLLPSAQESNGGNGTFVAPPQQPQSCWGYLNSFCEQNCQLEGFASAGQVGFYNDVNDDGKYLRLLSCTCQGRIVSPSNILGEEKVIKGNPFLAGCLKNS